MDLDSSHFDTELSCDKENEESSEVRLKVLLIAKMTPAQQCYARRQSRNIAYQKQRKEYFKGREEYLVTPEAPVSTGQDQQPSRYLKSLLKYQHSGRKIVDLLYPNGLPHAENALPLADVVELLLEMARPEKRNYMYASVEIRNDNSCGVCTKVIDA
jgi:hypothetical protein